MTDTLWGSGDDTEDSTLLRDAWSVLQDNADDAARERLRRAGWPSTLQRAPAQTAYSDVPGMAANPRIGGELPAWIIDRINRRQAAVRAMIDAVADDLELGAQPWVVPLQPPTPAEEVLEFGESGSRTFTVTGAYASPSLIARSGNLSWQAAKSAEDMIMAVVAEDALAGVGAWIRDKLVASAGLAAADVEAALAAVEDAGWTPDLLLLPLSRLGRLSALLGSIPASALTGVTIVAGAPVGPRIIVASRAGLDIRVSERAEALVSEPSIGGLEIAVAFWTLYSATAGAVQVVTA